MTTRQKSSAGPRTTSSAPAGPAVHRSPPGRVSSTRTGASGTAIAWSIRSRAYGQEDAGWGYFAVNSPGRLWVDITTGESTALTLGVTGDVSGAAWSLTYTVASGNSRFRVPVARGARGRTLTVTISGSSSAQAKIRGWLLESALGSLYG